MTGLGFLACAIIAAVAGLGCRVAGRCGREGLALVFFICYLTAACWGLFFLVRLIVGKLSAA
jgi:hypothetical protein